MNDMIKKAENPRELKIAKGRKKAIVLIVCIIVASVISMIFAAINRDILTLGFVISRVIRLVLELGLFYAMFIGKLWAKSFLTLSFSWGVLISILSISQLFGESPLWILILVIAVIYAIAIYIINSDDDFDAFFVSQRFNPFAKKNNRSK